jgi:hypothetical protein
MLMNSEHLKSPEDGARRQNTWLSKIVVLGLLLCLRLKLCILSTDCSCMLPIYSTLAVTVMVVIIININSYAAVIND